MYGETNSSGVLIFETKFFNSHILTKKKRKRNFIEITIYE